MQEGPVFPEHTASHSDRCPGCLAGALQVKSAAAAANGSTVMDRVTGSFLFFIITSPFGPNFNQFGRQFVTSLSHSAGNPHTQVRQGFC